MGYGWAIKKLLNDSSLQSITKATTRISHTLAPRPEKQVRTLIESHAKSGDLLNSVQYMWYIALYYLI